MRRLRETAGFPRPTPISAGCVLYDASKVLDWLDARQAEADAARMAGKRPRGPSTGEAMTPAKRTIIAASGKRRGRPSNAARAACVAEREAMKAEAGS